MCLKRIDVMGCLNQCNQRYMRVFVGVGKEKSRDKEEANKEGLHDARVRDGGREMSLCFSRGGWLGMK